MWWAFGLAFAATVFGFVSGWRVIERGRQPSASDGELLHWEDEPVPAWRQDRITAIFIAVHAASVLVLAVLFLLDLSRHQGEPGFQNPFAFDVPWLAATNDPAGLSQAFVLPMAIGLGFVWLAGGHLLAFPFATRLIRPIRRAIVADRVVSGPYFWPWSYFSHFSVEASAHLIRFYSKQTPELACMAWQPADVEVFKQASTLLGQYLPPAPLQPAKHWYRRRSVLVGLELFALTMPFALIGCVVFALALPWAWVYYTAVVLLIFFFSASIFRQL